MAGDRIAVVSILAGAAVAIGVPFINARLEGDRIEQQTQEARLDELRELLDGSLVHLWDAWGLMFDFQDLAGTDGPPPREQLIAIQKAVTRQVDVVTKDKLRLSIRVPTNSPLLTAHEVALSALLEYETHARTYLRTGVPGNVEKSETYTTLHNAMNQLTEGMGSFQQAVREFVSVPSAS